MRYVRDGGDMCGSGDVSGFYFLLCVLDALALA